MIERLTGFRLMADAKPFFETKAEQRKWEEWMADQETERHWSEIEAVIQDEAQSARSD